MIALARDNMKRESMTGMGLLHRGQLVRADAALIFGFPGLVGHAVDRLAAFVLGKRQALLVGGVLQPVGQAVAAEAGEIHQIEVLDVGALAQMPDQAAKSGGFEFRSGLLINGHGLNPVVAALLVHMELATDSAISQRKQWLAGANFAGDARARRLRKIPFAR